MDRYLRRVVPIGTVGAPNDASGSAAAPASAAVLPGSTTSSTSSFFADVDLRHRLAPVPAAASTAATAAAVAAAFHTDNRFDSFESNESLDRWPWLSSTSSVGGSAATCAATNLETAAARPSFEGLQRILDDRSLSSQRNPRGEQQGGAYYPTGSTTTSSFNPASFRGGSFSFTPSYSAERRQHPSLALRGDLLGGSTEPLPFAPTASASAVPAHRLPASGFLPVVPEAFATPPFESSPALGSSPMEGVVSLQDYLNGFFASAHFPPPPLPPADLVPASAASADFAPPAGFSAPRSGSFFGADEPREAGAGATWVFPSAEEVAPSGVALGGAEQRAREQRQWQPQRQAAEIGGGGMDTAARGDGTGFEAMCVGEGFKHPGVEMGSVPDVTMGNGLLANGLLANGLTHGLSHGSGSAADIEALVAMEMRCAEALLARTAQVRQGGVAGVYGNSEEGLRGGEGELTSLVLQQSLDLAPIGAPFLTAPLAAVTPPPTVTPAPTRRMTPAATLTATPAATLTATPAATRTLTPTPAPLSAALEGSVTEAAPLAPLSPLSPLSLYSRRNTWPAAPFTGAPAAPFTGRSADVALMQALELERAEKLAGTGSKEGSASLPGSGGSKCLEGVASERTESMKGIETAASAENENARFNATTSGFVKTAVPAPSDAMTAAAVGAPFLPALAFSTQPKRAKPLQREQQPQQQEGGEPPMPVVAAAPSAVSFAELFRLEALRAGGSEGVGGVEGTWGADAPARNGEGGGEGEKEEAVGRGPVVDGKEGVRKEDGDGSACGTMKEHVWMGSGQREEPMHQDLGDFFAGPQAAVGISTADAQEDCKRQPMAGSSSEPPKRGQGGEGARAVEGTGSGGESFRKNVGWAKRLTRDGSGGDGGSSRRVVSAAVLQTNAVAGDAAAAAAARGGRRQGNASQAMAPVPRVVRSIRPAPMPVPPVPPVRPVPTPLPPKELAVNFNQLPSASHLPTASQLPNVPRLPNASPSIQEFFGRRHTVSGAPTLQQLWQTLPHPSLPSPFNPSIIQSEHAPHFPPPFDASCDSFMHTSPRPLGLAPYSLAYFHPSHTALAAASAAAPAAAASPAAAAASANAAISAAMFSRTLATSQPSLNNTMAAHHLSAPLSTMPAPFPPPSLPFCFRTPPLPAASPPLCETPGASAGGSSSSGGSGGGAGSLRSPAARNARKFKLPSPVAREKAHHTRVSWSFSKRSFSSSLLPSTTLPISPPLPCSTGFQRQTFLPLSAGPPSFAPTSSLLPFPPNLPPSDGLRCLGCGIELDQENAREALALPAGVGPPLPEGSEMLEGRIPRVHGCNDCIHLLVPSYFKRRALDKKHTPNKST